MNLNTIKAKKSSRESQRDPVQANIKGMFQACAAEKTKSQLCFMPYAGHVSQVKMKDSVFAAKLFGIDFYCQKVGGDLTSDVFVPAWYCRTVTRNDQAFWTVARRTYNAYLIVRSTAYARSSRGTTLRLALDKPPSHEAFVEIPLDAWSNISRRAHTTCL